MNQVKTVQPHQDTQNKAILMTYATLAGAIPSLIPIVIFTTQFVQSGLWQWLATAIATGIISLSSFNAFRLTRSNKIDQASHWLIWGIVIPAASINLFAGGVVLGLIFNAFLIPIAVLSLLYQTKKLGRAFLIGAVISLYILISNRWTPFPRLAVEQVFLIALVVWISTAVFVLINFYFALRTFIAQSLRVKLVVAFLTVGVLAVGVMTFLNNRTTTTILQNRVGTTLHSLADSQAVAIGDLLAQQVNLIQTLALDQLLETRLEAVNAAYKGDPATIQARLDALDQQWISALDADLVIQNRVRNLTASGFRKFRANFPAHVEIFVTDKFGGVVAATNRTSDYYQGDEDWWQLAFNNGSGDIYIARPEFDEGSNTFGINIAAPVYDNDTGAVIGILRTTFDTAALADLLATAEFAQSGRVEIYMPDGYELEAKGGELYLETGELDPNIVTQFQLLEK